MRRILGLALIWMSIGCSQSKSPPPALLARLNAEAPVDAEVVRVKNCLVNGADQTQLKGTIKVSRGRDVNISGRLAAGEWGISGISSHWKQRPGEPHHVVGQLTRAEDRKLMLVFGVWSDQITKNEGVVHTDLMEARQSGDDVEFRIRFIAPPSSGLYVADIRLVGVDAPRKEEGTIHKAASLPVWRGTLEVQ